MSTASEKWRERAEHEEQKQALEQRPEPETPSSHPRLDEMNRQLRDQRWKRKGEVFIKEEIAVRHERARQAIQEKATAMAEYYHVPKPKILVFSRRSEHSGSFQVVRQGLLNWTGMIQVGIRRKGIAAAHPTPTMMDTIAHEMGHAVDFTRQTPHIKNRFLYVPRSWESGKEKSAIKREVKATKYAAPFLTEAPRQQKWDLRSALESHRTFFRRRSLRKKWGERVL